MTIKVVPCRILGPHNQNFMYTTKDGAEFFDLDEAIEYENSLVPKDTSAVKYDYVWSIQEAINKAVAEDRVVRFIWHKSNEEIRDSITDLKGCKLIKSDKESKDIAVLPPSFVKTYDFFEPDTKLTVSTK